MGRAIVKFTQFILFLISKTLLLRLPNKWPYHMTFLIYVSWYLNLMATIQSGQSETMSHGTTVHQNVSVNQNVSIKYHVTWHVKTHLTISIRLFSQTNKKQYQYDCGFAHVWNFFFIKSEFQVLTVCGISHDFTIRSAQDANWKHFTLTLLGSTSITLVPICILHLKTWDVSLHSCLNNCETLLT